MRDISHITANTGGLRLNFTKQECQCLKVTYLNSCLKVFLGNKHLCGYRSKDAGKAGSACRGTRIASILGKLRWLFWALITFFRASILCLLYQCQTETNFPCCNFKIPLREISFFTNFFRICA